MRPASLAVALLLPLAAGGACAPQVAPPVTAAADAVAAAIPVDHLILGIDSLERGIELLQRATGLLAVPGGVHPGRGTQNALLSLGDGRYLELLAPNPADTAARAGQTAEERARYFGAFRVPTPIGWAVLTTDAAAERARLVRRGLPASDVRPGSRLRPDGQTLRWSTVDPWGGVERDVLPFVIQWAADAPHPAAAAPAGCRFVGMAIESPAADSLRALFDKAAWPVPVRPGTTERLEFTLDCPRGRVQF